MIRLRKYGGIVVLLLALLLALQAGVSLLVRTHRMKGYLIAHLESAFGRPVQAGRFSVQILPIPDLDVEGVTIGEDPAFGNEYFLRAEHMTARLRWLGLLRGRFEFGTMSFTRPSLILVRNADGHWNLERWLPPARPAPAQISSETSVARAESTYHLQKIDFDEGRVNFKLGNEKRPFAFTDVSGSVEQVSSGRWQLQLKAQPWRSGVSLQSTGTLQVVGDVAGTSARLQPAAIRLHWEKVSLADLFRLVTGNDSGVRGQFALDGTASVGMGTPASDSYFSTWKFALQARATQIHRWDLTERDDNPRVNVNVNGLWELAAGSARADEFRVELPRSQFAGSAVMQTSGAANWHAQFQNMTVQGEDLLAWCRAFQPGIAEDVALNDVITGSVSASGWPLRWEWGTITSIPGSMQLPEQAVARIDPFHGTVRDGKFDIEGIRLRLPAEGLTQKTAEKIDKTLARPRAMPLPESIIDAALTQDSVAHQGALRLSLHLAETGPVFRLASAFGHSLNKGWEYNGGVAGSLVWNWGRSLKEAQRSGSLELTKARLQVAGLNEPLRVEETRLDWKGGTRSATLGKVDAFGATWSGSITEGLDGIGSPEGKWSFQLHADHLDATELDRWIGPRSRPNWLQRLLPSLLGDTNTARASELLRRISAEGELTADTFTIEKIKLAKAHARLGVHELHLDVLDADAQWAGGTVRGGMQALFSPFPRYQLSAQFENVNMTQFPWTLRWAERWSGNASGTVHLTTAGVGREELLKQLAGSGEVKLSKVEFRGWDVELSTESGGPSAGASRWASGEGEFQLSEQRISLDGFLLDGPRQRTQLTGTISFGMGGNLTFVPRPRSTSGTRTVSQARELRFSGQLENPAVVVRPVETDQVRP
jgi:hypothetical protein